MIRDKSQFDIIGNGSIDGSPWNYDGFLITPVNDVDVSAVTLFATIIQAKDSNGLVLKDDGGNLGIKIEDGGNVGIGVDNPTEKLEINGVVKIDEDTTDSIITFNDSSGGIFPIVNFNAKTGNNAIVTVWNNHPGDSSNNSSLQINRNVNTTGTVKTQFMRGDGVVTNANCEIGGNTDSKIGILNGDFYLGGATNLCKVIENKSFTIRRSVNMVNGAQENFESEFPLGTACYGKLLIRGNPNLRANFMQDTAGLVTLELATAGKFKTDGSAGFFSIQHVGGYLRFLNQLGSAVDVEYTVTKGV
jgi:hypothetical protein